MPFRRAEGTLEWGAAMSYSLTSQEISSEAPPLFQSSDNNQDQTKIDIRHLSYGSFKPCGARRAETTPPPPLALHRTRPLGWGSDQQEHSPYPTCRTNFGSAQNGLVMRRKCAWPQPDQLRRAANRAQLGTSAIPVDLLGCTWPKIGRAAFARCGVRSAGTTEPHSPTALGQGRSDQ